MKISNDMTHGKPAPVLIAFTLPLLLSAIFQQLYNLADSVIAGQYIGQDALAAIGASFSVTMIFMAVAFGCNAGCSVVIGRLFGEKKYRKVKTAVGTTLIAFLTLAAILTVVGRLLSSTLLKSINTPTEGNIFADGEIYLNVYVYGLVFLFLYNACNGIFTALGDSKTPLYFLIASSLTNIMLDILFVTVFKLGVAGIAWATFATQGMAAIVSLCAMVVRLKRLKIYSLVTECDNNETYPLFSFKMLGKISAIAIPSIVQQGVISVGNLLVQGVVNSFGKDVIAGFAAGVKLRTFAMSCFVTTSNALSTFTAQNMGAKSVDRVKKGHTITWIMASCVVLPFVIAYTFFGNLMINLFVRDITQEALKTGVTYLKIVSPFFFVIIIKACCDAVLKGSAKMVHFMVSTMADLFLRVGLAYVLSLPLRELGVWWSWPIGWTIATAISFVFYAMGVWYKPKYNKHRLLDDD